MAQKLLLRTSLHCELVDRIAVMVRNGGRKGDLLREAALARELGVSRTPVRAALQHLVSDGTLRAEDGGGYSVQQLPARPAESFDGAVARDRLHSLLLRDIILNEIEVPVSESALMRRYRVSRGDLNRALRRLVREGLAEPLPGRGWMLLELSVQRLSKSFHLRTLIEPAAVLDPGFRPAPESLQQLRAEHVKEEASISAKTSWQIIFDLDARFHETLAESTGNELILDIIRRENRLRRLAEYVSYWRLERVRTSISEHLQIIDALLAGNNTWASALMRQHLLVSLEETESHFAEDLRSLRESPDLFEHVIGAKRRGGPAQSDRHRPNGQQTRRRRET